MTQILKIFRKDSRHHWPEIAASLALLVAFAWVEIHGWNHERVAAFGLWAIFGPQFLSGMVPVLVPVSWMLLIVRVIQDESLVGDRQFWVTRPYDWRQLIFAKALFILAFVNFPLLILDIFLLARGGFHPAAYIPGLLYMQWLWIVSLFLATAVLAAVTARIAHMLLALLLVVLYGIGMSLLLETLPKAGLSRDDWWSGPLLIGSALAVILVQYSRRKTALARWFIVSLCTLLILSMVATPFRSVEREYPLSSLFPAQFSLKPPDSGSGSSPGLSGDAEVDLPLSVSGVPKDSLLLLNGMIVTMATARGFRWNSGWRPSAMQIFPGQKTAHVTFQIKQEIFDRLKSAPVTARLLLAFTLYREKNRRQFVVPVGDFALPEMGFCSTERYWNGVRCHAPMRGPTFLLITSDMAASTCSGTRGQTTASPGQLAYGSVQSGSDPAEMGISPIHEINFYLSNWDWSRDRDARPGICPGTPLILSNPEKVGSSRLELKFDNLPLADYSQSVGSGAFGIGLHIGR